MTLDVLRRKKILFWLLLLGSLALVTVPSALLLATLRTYYRFVMGWDPGVLKASPVRHLPHRADPAGAAAPRVHFVEFALKAPGAKRVSLAGDFNRWRPETLPLSKNKAGVWQTLLPLPPGRYGYLFQVDGAWTLDPAASSTSLRGELKTSLRQVP